MKRIPLLTTLLTLLTTLLTLLAACGTVEVGVGPAPDPGAGTTVAALSTEHARMATEVAGLEATLGITPAPTAPAALYQPISLGTAANVASGFASPLTGTATLADIPFELSETIFKSQGSPSPDDGYPTSIRLSATVPRAHKLHLLVNTGNGFAQFDGMTIGEVLVTCDGAVLPVAGLQLGRDVREWHLAHNVIYTAPRARQVWTGALAEYPHLTGHIDLVSFDLPATCRGGRLTAVEITDTSADTVGSLDPALNLFGVTVEYRR